VIAILSGSEDGIHKSAFALKEQIPNCVIRILHGAGHACQMEQPWLFDRYMIEFLKDHGLFPALRHAVHGKLGQRHQQLALRDVFMNDFIPIVNTMTSPCLMMVHPSVPAKTAAEFIALAKANPGKINMGSGGVGSTGHLGGELLQMMAGIKLTHVPYRGEAPAMTDLIAGHCQMVIATTGSAMEYCKAGSVRAIAVTLDMKLDALPDVKPLSDLLPGYMAIGWSGLVAPKNVPADIVALLHKHASDALAQPNIRQRVIDMGGVVPGGTAADFGQFMAEDTERWAKVIKVAGIKVN
jgi:tripartite-type tricarboxylate transporter receptor subunit TctC